MDRSIPSLGLDVLTGSHQRQRPRWQRRLFTRRHIPAVCLTNACHMRYGQATSVTLSAVAAHRPMALWPPNACLSGCCLSANRWSGGIDRQRDCRRRPRYNRAAIHTSRRARVYVRRQPVLVQRDIEVISGRMGQHTPDDAKRASAPCL